MGRISGFFIDLPRCPYNALALPCDCVIVDVVVVVVFVLVRRLDHCNIILATVTSLAPWQAYRTRYSICMPMLFTTSVMWRLQLRFDFDATAVRLFLKGHSDVTRQRALIR